MRVQTEEWRRFIPGVRMYKGKKTLFYNGEILFDKDASKFVVYGQRKRNTWQVIIVLPGVEVIPFYNFSLCGFCAFSTCKFASIFIPPSCREIGGYAFRGCNELIICNVPENTELGRNVFAGTKLFRVSPFEEIDTDGYYRNTEEVNAWVRDVNANEEYALHRACSAYNPILDIIYQIVRRDGLQAFRVQNAIGITPSQYLAANPFVQDVQKKVACESVHS